jgi:hypothetical protein
VGLYGTVKLGDKASLSGRAEWAHGAALGALDDGGNYSPATPASNVPLTDVVALTGTLQYHLWDNVISRLEVRWDHAANGAPAFNSVAANGAPADVNAVLVAANVIYKF